VPAEKLQEFDQFSLSFRLGFIHSLPENDFDIGSARISDVGYAGFFPKAILHELHRYAREIRNSNEDDTEFVTLIENLTTAFVYRPIAVQKIIHVLLADAKAQLLQLEIERNDTNTSVRSSDASNTTTITQATTPSPSMSTSAPRLCHATKCRLFVARGIRSTPMLCTNNRNMCSGCLNEHLRHRKVERLENEILEDTTSNEALAPLLLCLQKSITLKDFRALMQHLPTMNIQKRDDHIYGAARYLANSIGISLLDSDINESIDPPLTLPKINEMWRQAKFRCQCSPSHQSIFNIGNRAFCEYCSFLIFYDTLGDDNNNNNEKFLVSLYALK